MANTKRTERFDPNEVQGLLERAKAGEVEARNELVHRFQRLIAGLVNVCVTAQINPRSRQVQFLRLFARETTPLKNVAYKIKSQLAAYSAEELFHTGLLAAYEAVERCNKNYSSTLVIIFHEMIKDMIKDIKPQQCDESWLLNIPAPEFEHDLEFSLFIESLPLEHIEWVCTVLESDEKTKHPPAPEGLAEQFTLYLGYDPSM